MLHKPPERDPATAAEYECLECGTTVVSVSPEPCPQCGRSLRNRGQPLE